MDIISALQIAIAQLIGPSAIFYALLAIGLNLHFGYAGLLNFGQIAFALLGGYGVGIMAVNYDQPLWLGAIIGEIKRRTPLAVTLSLGERAPSDLAHWRQAGADRYLLRWETSDENLYRAIHPAGPAWSGPRIELVRTLQRLGYEAGSGVMIGIPGQSYASLAQDIALFAQLDLDMIGLGPYIAHPASPLSQGQVNPPAIDPANQVPNTEALTYRALALARLACPEANIPATTALATVNANTGRKLALERGANVIMPDLTPEAYRTQYQIYPGKASIGGLESAAAAEQLIRQLGRTIATGPGSRCFRTATKTTQQPS